MKKLFLVGIAVVGLVSITNSFGSGATPPKPANPEVPAAGKNVIDKTSGTLKDAKDKIRDHQQKASEAADQVDGPVAEKPADKPVVDKPKSERSGSDKPRGERSSADKPVKERPERPGPGASRK